MKRLGLYSDSVYNGKFKRSRYEQNKPILKDLQKNNHFVLKEIEDRFKILRSHSSFFKSSDLNLSDSKRHGSVNESSFDGMNILLLFIIIFCMIRTYC